MVGLAYGHNSNGRQMHIAALSVLLLFLSYPSVETSFMELGGCKLLVLFRLQGQLLIDPGCCVMRVRSRQVMVADAYKLGSSLHCLIRSDTFVLQNLRQVMLWRLPGLHFACSGSIFLCLKFGIFSFSEIFYPNYAYDLDSF